MTYQFNNDRPIYRQLVEMIGRDILSGVYPDGSKIPSVRDFASELKVNPNTVVRALNELEKEGLIQTNRTNGKFVTTDQNKKTQLKELLAKEQVDYYLNEMESLGYDFEQALSLLETRKEELNDITRN